MEPTLAAEVNQSGPPGGRQRGGLRCWLGIFAAGACSFLYVWLAQSAQPADPDAYYHLRYAELLRHGFVRDFPWMLSQLAGDRWVDHHLLYHLLLVPFTFLGEPGIQISAAFFAGLMVGAVAFTLQRLGARPWWLWTTLLCIASSSFFFRMALPRALSLVAALLALVLWAMSTGRPRLIFFLCLLFSWAYQGSITVVPIALCFWLAGYLTKNSWSPRVILAAAAGYAAGLVINPFFPHTIDFLLFHVIYMPSHPFGRFVSGEWSSDPGIVILYKLWPHFGLLLSGIVALIVRPAPDRRLPLALLLVDAMFVAGILRAFRFVEYFVVVNIAFAGVAWGPVIGHQLRRTVPRTVVAVVLLIGVVVSHRSLRHKLAVGQVGVSLKEFAGFVRQHVPAKTRMTNIRWDLFPVLFYELPDYYFTVGLEPAFLFYDQDKRARAWTNLVDGASPDVVADLTTLESRHVIVSPGFDKTIARLDRDPRLQVVYQDRFVRLYEVAGAARQSPPPQD